MILYFECIVCGDKFPSKKKIINHLKGEKEEANEQALNCEEDILLIEDQLKELQDKTKGEGRK